MRRLILFSLLFCPISNSYPQSNPPLELPLRGESGEIILGLGDFWDAVLLPQRDAIATHGSLGIIVWDIETAQPIRLIGSPNDPITILAFSPDGKKGAGHFWSPSEEIQYVWDLETGELLQTFLMQGTPMLFTPDGSKILFNSINGGGLFDIESGERIQTFEFDNSVGINAAFSPDGTQLFAGTKLWDVKTGALIRTPPDAGSPVSYSPDGTQILSCYDEIVILREFETGKIIHRFEGHTDWISSIAFSQDGKRVLTASADRTVRIWDTDSGEEVTTFFEDEGWIESATFSSDGEQVFILTSGDVLNGDGNMALWDAETGQLIQTFSGHSPSVNKVAFLPDGKTVLTQSSELIFGSGARTTLWDADTGKLIRSYQGIGPISFSYDGTLVLLDNLLINLDSGDEMEAFSGDVPLALSPDGTVVFTVGYQKPAKLWNVQNGSLIREFTTITKTIFSAVFLPDGNRILTVNYNGKAQLLDVETGDTIHTFWGNHPIVAVAVSSDGTKMMTGNDYGTVRVLDAQSREEITAYSVHDDDITSLAFSPDGNWALSGSSDNTAKLWVVQTGEVLRTFSGHTYRPMMGDETVVNTVAFSPDGMKVVSGGYDGTARIWDISDLTATRVNDYMLH